MSKTMEQTSLSSGSPAGRVGQVIPGSKEEKSKAEHQFGFKGIGTLLGVVMIMIGIVGYGVYSQRSRTGSESRISSVAEPVPPTPVEQATPLTGAIAQPAQISQPLPVSTEPPTKSREVSPAESQTESKHTDIYFDFGKSRLRADATATLQQQAAILKKDGNWAVLIQGYADQHGPTEYNRSLALRRAESVKQFLVELGVPESSMKVVSLGKDSAICDDQSRTCQRLNRRVHVEMVKMEMEAAAPSIATTMEGTTDLTRVSDEAMVTPDNPPIEEPTANPPDQP